VACLVHQSLSGQAPLYLADDCRLVSDSTRRSLRSADGSTCVVLQILSSYGDRTFAATASRDLGQKVTLDCSVSPIHDTTPLRSRLKDSSRVNSNRSGLYLNPPISFMQNPKALSTAQRCWAYSISLWNTSVASASL